LLPTVIYSRSLLFINSPLFGSIAVTMLGATNNHSRISGGDEDEVEAVGIEPPLAYEDYRYTFMRLTLAP